MKKLGILLVCCFLLLVSGCGGSVEYDEQKMVEHAKEVVTLVNEGDFEGVLRDADEKMKEMNPEELQEAVEGYLQQAGEFTGFGEHETIEKDGMITTALVAEYEHLKYRFNVTFDEEYHLCGLYLYQM